jgi:hypothetical protein
LAWRCCCALRPARTRRPDHDRRWLRDCEDDAAKVLAVIREAQAPPTADPVAWIEAAIQERTDRRGVTLKKVCRPFHRDRDRRR